MFSLMLQMLQKLIGDKTEKMIIYKTKIVDKINKVDKTKIVDKK